MIKAIFFDIDGTLVSFKTHAVPQSAVRALRELREKGILVFIATGRHELLVDNVDISLFDGIVSLNGQCVRAGGEVIHTNVMAPEDVAAAVRYSAEHGIATIFESIDFIRLNTVTDMARRGAALIDLKLPRPEDISDMASYPMLQLISFVGEEQERDMMRGMTKSETTRWTPLLCDIMPHGGGKHIGIQKMLDHFGILREESMAFGDGDNDITMLRHAGIGVAMGNADPCVKEAADYVTTGVDGDGVARALRHFGIL